jgi:hypothetical protein
VVKLNVSAADPSPTPRVAEDITYCAIERSPLESTFSGPDRESFELVQNGSKWDLEWENFTFYPSQACFISICERMVWVLIGEQMAGIYGLLGQPVGKCVNKGIQLVYLV